MKRTSRTRGQALIETALTVTILVLLSLGILQFGYAFVELGMVTNAARDGARFGAARPNRTACGCLQTADTTQNTGNIATLVRNELSNVMSAADANALTISVAQNPSPCASGNCPCTTCSTPTPSTLRTVDVTVTGTMPYMFRLVGTGFTVNKLVRFRDEQL